MTKKIVARNHQPTIIRLLPLIIVSIIGAGRMLDVPGFLYATPVEASETEGAAGVVSEELDPIDEYDRGWWDGYADGYGGGPELNTTGESADYRSGYSDGYPVGISDAEDEGPDPIDEYDRGWWDGYAAGYDGEPEADVSTETADYQEGYSDGHATGGLDAADEMEDPEPEEEEETGEPEE